MASRLLLVVIMCLLGEAASAGPLRRLFGRPRACRPVVIVPARPAERVPLKQPEAVTLRLKFDKAPTYYAEFTSDATQTTSVMGQAVTYQQHQAYYLAWTPRGMTDAGDGVMEMEFVAFKMNMDIGGVTVSVDTTKPAAAGDKAAAAFAAVVGTKVQFHVTPLGNVVAVVGAEELVRKLGGTHPQMEPLIKTLLSREALKALAEAFVEGLPEGAVRPGDVWNHAGNLSMGEMGEYCVETRLRYRGRMQGFDRIDVSQRLAFRPRKTPLGMQKAMLSDGAGTGQRVFDAAKGRFVASELQQTFAGTTIVEVAGKETPVGVTSIRVQRIRIGDRPLHGE